MSGSSAAQSRSAISLTGMCDLITGHGLHAALQQVVRYPTLPDPRQDFWAARANTAATEILIFDSSSSSAPSSWYIAIAIRSSRRTHIRAHTHTHMHIHAHTHAASRKFCLPSVEQNTGTSPATLRREA